MNVLLIIGTFLLIIQERKKKRPEWSALSEKFHQGPVSQPVIIMIPLMQVGIQVPTPNRTHFYAMTCVVLKDMAVVFEDMAVVLRNVV